MIVENLNSIKEKLPGNVKLIAVSKTKPLEMIMEGYNAGHWIYGENKVQELIFKYEKLPKDIEWHMIGHLQTNKVKYIAPFVHLIHSVDSMKLLRAIDKEGKKINRIIPCLLQIKIADEETKFGLSEDDLKSLLDLVEKENLNHVKICGLMGMATYTDDKNRVEKEFSGLAALFTRLKESHFKDNPDFKELSMGMSHDYDLAVKSGSTMVRIGSSIFGERNYSN